MTALSDPAVLDRVREVAREAGYLLVKREELDPVATVTNVQRMSADEYRADVDVLVRHLGRVGVCRVYAQLVTDGSGTHWSLKWPRQHKEGFPRDFWVITATMTGRFASAVQAAMVDAIMSAVPS